ncbi:MAG: DNA polymerase III subunit delta [Firmicutes bacterium]|nr:DNA polymerase III subunit delta [Bacillota bacterium]
MEQKKLMNDLKNGELQSSYLLYGDERFLVSHYAKAIENAVFDSPSQNSDQFKDVFDGAIPANDIIMTAETLPFFAERRLIYVRDSRLFATGRKNDSEAIAEYLPKIPKETIIVFVESEVDRRSKLFRQISKVGVVLDCTPPTVQTLATWVTRLAKERGKILPPHAAHLLVQTVGTNMSAISREMDKLAAYCGENTEISPADIKEICTPTLESRIFDLTKAMGSGRVSDALAMYKNMLMLKESPIMILTMIIRQLRIILLSKCAKEKGMTVMQTAQQFNLRDFMVSEALEQGRRFTVDGLLSALEDCLETDVKIKTGLISPEFGVEMLIIKYGK